MRGLPAFEPHPWSFEKARAVGVQRGYCTYVVDGDTFDVLVDDGRHQYSVINVRLRGIDTPELYTSDVEERKRGQLAKTFTSDRILDKFILIATYRDVQTFGRWVADIFIPFGAQEFGGMLSLTDLLNAAGHVK